MLTIELDNDTELALKELANQQGKTLEQWVKETLSKFTILPACETSETCSATITMSGSATTILTS
jgi:predicted transcriptional regulator